MVRTWFKIFYRNSKKNWLNVAINVAGLMLGFAGLLLILLHLQDEELYNSQNPNKDNIFRVSHLMSNGDIWSSSTVVEGPTYVKDLPEVTSYYISDSWYDDELVDVKGKKVYTRDIHLGEKNFFEFFPYKLVEGSFEKFGEARNHIAISKKQAEIFFGETSAIGKTLGFYKRSFIVTAVYELEGKNYFEPSIVSQFEKELEGHWGNFNYNLFIKTIKDVDEKLLTEKMNALWIKYQNEPMSKEEGMPIEEWTEKYGTTALLEKLSTIRLHSKAGSAGPEGVGNYQLILILLSLSTLLIIISCVNFINLSTASATQRAKEVGIKKTLGLSKFVLTRQFVLEIVLQGLIAFILSLLLVELILPYFNEFMGKDLNILEGTAVLKVFLVVLIITSLIGNIPALYLANFKSVEVLKGNVSRSKKGIWARNIMLGLQFAISGFFLIGSSIVFKQVSYMMNKDMGFSGDQIVLVRINEPVNRFRKYQVAKKELIKNPNITQISSNYFIPGGGNASSTMCNYKDITVQTNVDAIDYGYFNMSKIKMLKGRGFSQELALDSIKGIVINETLAKAYNIYDDPIGKEIKMGWRSNTNDGKMNVIGMVEDYHVYGLDNKIPPILTMHWNAFDGMKYNFRFVQFKIKPDNIDETIVAIENYWSKNIEQGYPFEYKFLDEYFARTYEKFQKQKTLFSVLTTIVIIVSLLGLFALATLTIQQRLKEVAIRKTLGASVKEIMFQLIKSFVKITLIASVILIPIAYYFMQNWLDNFVYRIDMPILSYIVTPIVLIILVFAVVGLKAYNATKVDLIKYLKFE
ncbi:putative ABC transport system permease protein [Tenacibaculum adriaticum]|uniref:Putative ABC transport system permease protein n=1 Tax=Tenacibaculum adriaticum TaxID=413713 RepID=A0A5S5DQV8_9FLAO|nr:ABC transporter permease [Tenacibaculum adriaticum]TYP98343.1 putative ABC transport system permease protein [Tenacibaculum adriaticum]